MDDAIETSLMSLLFSSQLRTMVPRVESKNFEGVSLIRPMYMIREKDIIAWTKYNGLNFINCACPIYEKGIDGKREEMKKLIKYLENKWPESPYSIFKAYENVDLTGLVSIDKKD